jgi:RNA polymerase sigma-70 factor, ECF subfamily
MEVVSMLGIGLVRQAGRSAAVRPDEELIAEALSGSTGAFAEVASRHRARVQRLCRRFFSDPETARDVAQESFLKAFAALSSYRAEMPFGSWLRAIVVNVCYDELRRRRRRPESLVGDFTEPELNWIQLVNTMTPEEIVAEAETRREAHDLAHRLLDTLKDEDRMVLVLKDSEDLGVAEIAQMLGWSEAKVKIRVFRARQTLRGQAKRMMDARGRRK